MLLIILSRVARSFVVAALAATSPHESWSVIRFGDHPVGYLHESADEDAAGRVVTETEMRFVLNRLGSRVEMRTSLVATESADGALLSVTADVRLSEQATRASATFEGKTMRIVTSAGGREYERDVPLEGAVAGPERIRLLSQGGLRHAGDRVEFSAFVGETLSVASVARVVEAVEAEAIRVREEVAGHPPRTLWLGADGRVERSRDAGPFGDILTARTDRATALAAAGEGGGAGVAPLPEEMYDRTLVRSNVRLPRSREIDSITVRIRHRKPELGFPDLAISNQTVLSRTADRVILRVERPRPPSRAIARPVELPKDADRALALPNGYLASEDEEVRRIAEEATGGEKDAWLAATRLERWVHDHMTLDLGVVFAPASEVARNRRGTCVAYSVLLSSLARAAGLPSRVMMGFVYVNGAWGGHAWTEVLVDGRFLPLDGAVYGAAPAGAGRFAFGASTLGAGAGELHAAGQRLFGQVEIDVIEYSVEGRTTTVSEAEPLYRLEGDRWSSPGLGLSLARPAGFSFEELDSVWPSDTLVLMRGADGASVRLRQLAHGPGGEPARERLDAAEKAAPSGALTERKIANRNAAVSIADSLAALAVSDGSDLYVLVAEGPEAARRMNEAAGTLSFERR